ncbi:helix-turn-helix domain-containing protein [Tropicimonas sp. IMCC34043]|uniref:helix-turn-helix domain-containing protein n=1 Tax=Tropicimonas sp. IMCC34043 TaxID=2248760 RepID=UPI000E23CAEF|nr:helix-turn-helix domain-containing protein [Tropicimonas sp. IMCC34043]
MTTTGQARTDRECITLELEGRALAEIIKEAERAVIVHALNVTGGNRARAADILGITAPTLRNKLAGYNIKATFSVA